MPKKAGHDRVGGPLARFKEKAAKAETGATEMVSDDNLAELIVNVTHKETPGATVSTRCENPTCRLEILRLRSGQTQRNV